MAELARSSGGDGEAILERLRAGAVEGFWAEKKDELETYFEANGYVEPVDPFEPAAIRVRVAQSFASNGVPRERALDRADRLVTRLAGTTIARAAE